MSFSMRILSAPAACAAIALAGCGGTQSSGTALVPMQRSAVAASTRPAHSWMLPQAKHGALLYTSEYGGGVVDVFSYPRGNQVGVLTGFVNPQGECIDKKGDVFIVNASINVGQPTIIEYAHGGAAPIATLADNNQQPYGCAIDLTSDTLAVSNESGAVALYQNAQGNPTYVTDSYQALMLWCGYDNAGNLYVDGLNRKDNSQFDVLPKGTTRFMPVQLSKSIGFPGNIQWDGKELTLGDALYGGNDTSAIYQLQISGSTAKITGTTVLSGSMEVFGSWIDRKRVIGPDEGPNFDAVQYWRYPAGGKSTESLSKGSGSFDGVFGAAVSR